MANILLIVGGSQGDLNPYLGVGAKLKQRGHSVTLISNEHWREEAHTAGLAFAPDSGEALFQQCIVNPDVQDPRKSFRWLLSIGMDLMREDYRRITELYVPGKTLAVVQQYGMAGLLGQERLAVPAVALLPSPMALFSEHSPTRFPSLPLPRFLARWGMRLACRKIAATFEEVCGGPINQLRSELGLAPIGGVMEWARRSHRRAIGLWPPWLYAPQPDWPANSTLTGFVQYDGATAGAHSTWQDGLPDGSSSIVFTAGTGQIHAHEFFAEAADACCLLNRPGIFLTQYPEHLPSPLPPQIHHLRYAPLGRLLHKSAAIVHHGGIGTAARALSAGIPQLMMPTIFDQCDNAYRFSGIGVAASIGCTRFKAKNVARILRQLLDSDSTLEKCRYYAAKLEQTDDLTKTCELIELAIGSA